MQQSHAEVYDMGEAGLYSARICSLLCLLLAQPPGFSPAMANSDPWVETSDAGGGAVRIRAHIQIEAPPAAVWSVLVACDTAPKVIPHLESCKMQERDPAGRWDIRNHVINPPLLPRMRTTVRNDFTPFKRLEFKLISGDMRRSDGFWNLTPSGNGTKLSYDAVIEPSFAAPQFIVARSIQSDFPLLLSNIQRYSLERSRAR